MRHRLRSWHKWVGLCASLFLLLVAVTAIALNHRSWWLPLTLKQSASQQAFTLAQAEVWAADPFVAGHYLGADAHHLYESRDAGQHWQELKLYVPAEHVVGICFSARTQDLLWVALQDVGIYASDDGGYVWEELSDLPFDPVAGERIRALAGGAQETLFVQTSLAWYRYRASDSATAKAGWQSLTSTEGRGQSLQLQDWIWRLHTGKFWGSAGVWLYDLLALAVIWLAISGIQLSLRGWGRKARRLASSE